jgi:hypothetical protein
VLNKVRTSPGESVSRQTTELDIIPNSNEIAIHTNPAEEREPPTIPSKCYLLRGRDQQQLLLGL